jgi:hypothetical protein
MFGRLASAAEVVDAVRQHTIVNAASERRRIRFGAVIVWFTLDLTGVVVLPRLVSVAKQIFQINIQRAVKCFERLHSKVYVFKVA